MEEMALEADSLAAAEADLERELKEQQGALAEVRAALTTGSEADLLDVSLFCVNFLCSLIHILFHSICTEVTSCG